MTAQFTLSAFGDEIADDVDEQLRVLNELDIRYLELRRAWGTNVLELSDDEVSRLSDRCEAHSISVSCIGSPVGKSPIGQPIGEVVSDLERILDIGRMLGTDKVAHLLLLPRGRRAAGRLRRRVYIQAGRDGKGGGRAGRRTAAGERGRPGRRYSRAVPGHRRRSGESEPPVRLGHRQFPPLRRRAGRGTADGRSWRNTPCTCRSRTPWSQTRRSP